MDQAIETMPFTESPGRLRVAPIGALLPQNVVSSENGARESRFVDSWPDSWVLCGETDPEFCRSAGEVSTEQIQVDYFSPIRMAVTERSLRWTFGFDAIAMDPLIPSRDSARWELVRQMVGWESKDRTARVFAEQVVVVDGLAGVRGREIWQVTVGLEEPYVPRPVPPKPTGLQRFLRLLRLWTPPVVPMPDPEPLFRIYTARGARGVTLTP